MWRQREGSEWRICKPRNAKGCWQHQKLRERHRTDSSLNLKKEPTLPTSGFWTSSLQKSQRIHFCCFTPSSLWYFGYRSPRKQIQVVSVLYIFWILGPYQIHDLQIISPVLRVVYSLSWWCTLRHKFLKCWWNLIHLFFLLSLCFWCCIKTLKKPLPKPRSQRFTPVFSAKSFIVLGLIFRSMIYFELIVVHGVGKGSTFTLSYVDIHLSKGCRVFWPCLQDVR